MPELAVLDGNGEPVASVEVPEFLTEGDVNTALLHQVAVAHLANRRQGNASTKTRSDVRGSGDKMFRQKGLGRARMGSIRSPIRVGGGVAFGPKPRSFRQHTPRKMRRRALLFALRDKLGQDAVTVVQEIPGDRERPRTKAVAEWLGRLGVAGRKVAIVLAEHDAWVHLSARNLPNVSVTTSALLHTYEVLSHDVLVLVPGALDGLIERVRECGAEPATVDDVDEVDEVEVS